MNLRKLKRMGWKFLLKRGIIIAAGVLTLSFPISASAVEANALLNGSAGEILYNVTAYPEIAVIGSCERLETAVNYYQSLPVYLQKMIRDNDVKIYFTDHPFTVNGGAVGGVSKLTERGQSKKDSIFVCTSIEDRQIRAAIPHEIGHVYSHLNDRRAENIFDKCRRIERDGYWGNLGTYDDAYYDNTEYFAEIFEAYFVNRDREKAFCPLSERLMDILIQCSFGSNPDGTMVPIKTFEANIPAELIRDVVVDDVNREVYIQQYYAGINQRRAAAGLAPLEVNLKGQEICQQQVNDAITNSASFNGKAVANSLKVMVTYINASAKDNGNGQVGVQFVNDLQHCFLDTSMKTMAIGMAKDSTGFWQAFAIATY